jgi:hypothetical protein
MNSQQQCNGQESTWAMSQRGGEPAKGLLCVIEERSRWDWIV